MGTAHLVRAPRAFSLHVILVHADPERTWTAKTVSVQPFIHLRPPSVGYRTLAPPAPRKRAERLCMHARVPSRHHLPRQLPRQHVPSAGRPRPPQSAALHRHSSDMQHSTAGALQRVLFAKGRAPTTGSSRQQTSTTAATSKHSPFCHACNCHVPLKTVLAWVQPVRLGGCIFLTGNEGRWQDEHSRQQRALPRLSNTRVTRQPPVLARRRTFSRQTRKVSLAP